MMPISVAYLFSKLENYSKFKEAENSFYYFKQITSNLTWDNNDLNHLVLIAFHYKYNSKQSVHHSIQKVIFMRVEGLLNANDKYKEGTIMKKFNIEDEKLDRLVVREITESQARGENIEGLEEWVDISIELP